MNTAIATQRIQSTCVLTLALLMHGASDAGHLSKHNASDRHDSFVQDAPRCADRHHGTRATIAEYDAGPAPLSCNTPKGSEASAPAGLASPLPGQDIRANQSIRYSF